jgi:hypothetical protein
MLCAHTVRRLKPGSYEEFREAFDSVEQPPDWVRFHVLRSLADENEVISFGFFDGNLEELERSQDDGGYARIRERIDALVDTVVSNGVYEIAESKVAEGASAS